MSNNPPWPLTFTSNRSPGLAVGNTTRFLVSAVTVMVGSSHLGLFLSTLVDETHPFTTALCNVEILGSAHPGESSAWKRGSWDGWPI